MELRVVKVNGLDLAIGEAGAGGQPLLFVHGFGGAKQDFTGWLDRCAGLGWHAVAPDLRGHGASDHPAGEENYSLELMAADVVGLMDALGWSRTILLGHSMGGMVAQLVALHHADRLDALVLMDTSHHCPDSVKADMVDTAQAIVRQGGVELLVEIQKSAGPDPIATPAYLRMIAEDPGYEEFCRNKTLATASDCWAAIAGEMVSQPDRLEALRSLRVPTLVIAGEQDAGFIDQCRAMASAIPGAQLAVMPEGGHSPQFEAPAPWWASLSDFLAQHRTAVASADAV